MTHDDEEETSQFPDFLRDDFDEIQLREIPPTPIQSTFDIERKLRTRTNSAVSNVSGVSALSETDSEYLMTIASPSRSFSKTRGRSHSNESRYSIFPAQVSRCKSTASTQIAKKSRIRGTSVAVSEWSTALDVPLQSEARESRASRAPRASRTSISSSSSRSPSKSRGYSNADSDRTISLQVSPQTGTIPSRPEGISNSDSMIFARTSINQDWADHRNLLTTQKPPPIVPKNDLMAQFENFVDAIDEVPTKRITLKQVVVPAKKVRWMQLKGCFQNLLGKRSDIFDEKTTDSDGTKEQRWKSRCSIAAAFVGSVLVIYIVFMIWASQRAGNGKDMRAIYEASCSMVNATNFGLHILINIMAMVVSISSDYALYFVSSSTREEIDEAHARGRSFDIGVLSLRNLRSFKKKILFGLLVLSSLPVHLFSNSVVFGSNPEFDYDVIIVSPQFLNKPSVDCSQDVVATCVEIDNHPRSCKTHPLNLATPSDTSNLCNTSMNLHKSATENKLQHLNATECLTAYSTISNPGSNYGNVLVVTKDQPLFTNNTVMLAFHHMEYSSVLRGHGWTCGPDDPLPGQSTCDISNLILNADIWTLGPSLLPITSNSTSLASYERWQIDHCLAETLPFQTMCKLQCSRLVTICIILATAVKFICIVFMAVTMTQPVLTVKDAISSFQKCTDAVTSNRNFIHRKSAWKSNYGLLILEPEMEGRPRNLRWFHGASLSLWIATLFLGTVLLATPLVFLTTATVPIPHPYSIGLGNYSPLAIVEIFSWSTKSFVPLPRMTNTQLFPTALLANLPQFVVSALLFLFAQVYIRMLSANTFSSLTNPSPSLKSRKIMGFSCACLYISAQAVLGAILHFLVSQALFVHHVEIVGSNGSKEPLGYMDLGYNPLAILVSLVFGGMMLGVLMATGLWRLNGGQLVGSESMEIAAACNGKK